MQSKLMIRLVKLDIVEYCVSSFLINVSISYQMKFQNIDFSLVTQIRIPVPRTQNRFKNNLC